MHFGMRLGFNLENELIIPKSELVQQSWESRSSATSGCQLAKRSLPEWLPRYPATRVVAELLSNQARLLAHSATTNSDGAQWLAVELFGHAWLVALYKALQYCQNIKSIAYK
ncbi:Uncharacterized protein Fot_27359 [Forsythia ovata]|uniref:Uncharacterized protein n=1 Tax=Forsythia ovata TaxID=205694 RepID=A0ABD1UEI7_9LAMI